jgi:hypothetical protein
MRTSNDEGGNHARYTNSTYQTARTLHPRHAFARGARA